jgi:hypothetical protein
MAVQPPTSADRLAKDLRINPASCQISPHLNPAVHVVEAIEVSPNGDITPHSWLVCDTQLCVGDAMLHADAISPPSFPSTRRDATVADLEELSGLEIPAVVA